MKKKILIPLFAALIAAQLSVPASIIVKSQGMLSTGELVKFRTAPVDPYDLLRGRYVALDLEALRDANLSEGGMELGDRRTRVFALLSADAEGFTEVADIVLQEPSSGLYLTLDYDPDHGLHNPFDKYFLNQKSAPRAEAAYWSATRDGQRNTYLTVRIKKGEGIVEGLFIDDIPIENYSEALPE